MKLELSKHNNRKKNYVYIESYVIKYLIEIIKI